MKKKLFNINFKRIFLEFARSHLVPINRDGLRNIFKVSFLTSFGEIGSLKIIRQILVKERSNFKLKVLDIKDRISSVDIQIDWREILECILLSLFTIFLYMSVFLAELSFIPFMIIAIKRGWKEGIIYLTWSLVISFLLVSKFSISAIEGKLFLFSPIHYSFIYISQKLGVTGTGLFDYYFMYGIFGIFLGYLIDKNYRLRYIIFLSTVAYIGMVLIVFLIAGAMEGGYREFFTGYQKFVDETTRNYINSSLAHLSNYRGVLLTRGIDYVDLKNKIILAAEVYKRNIIFGAGPKGGYLLKQIILIFLGVVAVKFYFRKKLNRAALVFDITNFSMEDIWIWGLILSWGLVYLNLYLKVYIIDIIAWNAAVIFSFLFFLRGLSVLKVAADRINIPPLFQYTLFGVLILYSFILFIILITGIGVADIWLFLKEKLQQNEEKDR